VKLLSICAFFLIVSSSFALVSGGQGGRLLQQSWLRTSDVLPEDRMSELGSVIPTYTDRVWQWLPLVLRHKFADKLRSAVELMIWRMLLIRYVAPGFIISAFIGLLEGFWSRSSQKSLVKIHSPWRFNLGLIGLGSSTVVTMLWVAAPMSVPLILVVFCALALAVVSIRSLVVHAPSRW
jgi:Domain of unknown function (DUF4400)